MNVTGTYRRHCPRKISYERENKKVNSRRALTFRGSIGLVVLLVLMLLAAGPSMNYEGASFLDTSGYVIISHHNRLPNVSTLTQTRDRYAKVQVVAPDSRGLYHRWESGV